MSIFSSTYEALAEGFRCKGISVDSPGYCDTPSFFDVERGNPDYLNHYAAFVAKRPYDPQLSGKGKSIRIVFHLSITKITKMAAHTSPLVLLVDRGAVKKRKMTRPTVLPTWYSQLDSCLAAMEVTAAVISIWGVERVGVRLSPLSPFNDIVDNAPTKLCNGQLKPDTFLSRFLVKFPLKFQRGLVA